MLEPDANKWSFLTFAVQAVCTAFTTALTAWFAYQTVLKPKLNDIHTLVNGNLDVEKRKNAALRQKLTDHGINPD